MDTPKAPIGAPPDLPPHEGAPGPLTPPPPSTHVFPLPPPQPLLPAFLHPLSQHPWVPHLLGIPLGVGQLGGDVEHDLLVTEVAVDRLAACLPVGHIQPPPKPGWWGDRHPEPGIHGCPAPSTPSRTP